MRCAWLPLPCSDVLAVELLQREAQYAVSAERGAVPPEGCKTLRACSLSTGTLKP